MLKFIWGLGQGPTAQCNFPLYFMEFVNTQSNHLKSGDFLQLAIKKAVDIL